MTCGERELDDVPRGVVVVVDAPVGDACEGHRGEVREEKEMVVAEMEAAVAWVALWSWPALSAQLASLR